MRRTKARGAVSILACTAAFAACSSSAPPPAVDAGVPLGTKSAGTVTMRLVLPADKAFCDQSSGCESVAHVVVLTPSGGAVGASVPWCSTTCSAACMPSPCPGIACFAQGIALKTTDYPPWDGSTSGVSTCGQGTTCYQPGFIPAGHYVARMCATPGTLATADGGSLPTCTATGPRECVDVPFDFPSATVVEGSLP
jgi:hypothetical protein